MPIDDEIAHVRADMILDAGAQAFGRGNGYLLTRAVDAETIVAVLATIAGGAEILRGGITQEGGVSDRWTYPSLAHAVVAFGHWWLDEWAGEPAGWIRHQPSNRRRSYDPATVSGRLVLVDEWVAP